MKQKISNQYIRVYSYSKPLMGFGSLNAIKVSFKPISITPAYKQSLYLSFVNRRVIE